MADTIDDREEKELLDAVKAAADLVATGMTPDAAVEKVARDNGFGPGKIRVVGHAYNTGQQLHQWRNPAGTGILDKLASFEMCDPQRVIDGIYNGPTPSEKAAAARVHGDYARPPHWAERAVTKAASYKIPRSAPEPYAPDPAAALNRACGKIQRAKQAADEARREAAAAKDAVTAKVAGLVAYFRKAAHDRHPFHVVETAALAYMGDGAKSLMDVVHTRANSREKRAADGLTSYAPVDLKAEPYTLISSALDAARRSFAMTKRAAELAAAHAAVKEAELRPFGGAALEAAEEDAGKDLDGDGEKGESAEHRKKVLGDKKAADVFGTEKRAFGFGTEVAAIAAGDILAHKATHQEAESDPYGDVAGLDSEISQIRNQAKRVRRPEKKAFLGAGIGTAIGSSIGRQVGTVGKTKDDLVDDEWMKLEDPEHENELRKIKAHAMINQLMTDPDDPISGHDPDKVLAAYNEISSATPRLAESIATLRPQLRKHLEGHREPFESKEMLDIEHGLARSKMPTPNTSILGETPDKLLG